jgi:lipoate-protein ligase A
LSGDIVTSYRRLSRALLAALQRVGIDAESKAACQESGSAPHTSRNANPVCFEVPSHYELTAGDGRKLVGSAQMRTSDAVLQHGTVPLVGDIARICHYLKDPPAADRVRARAATLESALGRPVAWEQVAKAMIAGFALALNLTLDEAGLTPKEQDWASEICADKYGNDAWTWRA